MKILIMSDGPDTPTGLANNVKLLINGLKDEHELAMLNWQYYGVRRMYNDVIEYPAAKHEFGKDSLYLALKDFKPDILITIGDYWMMNYIANQEYQQILKSLGTKWWAYITIDSGLIPYQFREFLKYPDKLISMSKFGCKILSEIGIDSLYIPYGIDLNIFKKMDNKSELKKKYGISSEFLVGSIFRNQDRKQPARLIEAFSIFSKDKDNVGLYLHCDKNDPIQMTYDKNNNASSLLMLAIKHFADTNDKKLWEKIMFPPEDFSYINGFNRDRMPMIYNTFDVHALSTSGEGFGIPILESMACGIPNIMTDYTTAEELIGNNRGFRVKVKDLHFGYHGTFRALVDVNDFAEKLDILYNLWKDNKLYDKFGKNCEEFAKQYEVGKVEKMWKEMINSV